MLRQLLEYGRGDGGVTVAAAVEDRAHGADILAVGVRAVAVGDEELDVRAAAMMSVLANTAQRLCQLALMRGEPAAAQRAVPDAPLAGRKRKSRNLGFLRIFGDFLCEPKVTRRRQDQPIHPPPRAKTGRREHRPLRTLEGVRRLNAAGHTGSALQISTESHAITRKKRPRLKGVAIRKHGKTQ